MLRWQVSCMVSLALIVMTGAVQAKGLITFSGVPVVTDLSPISSSAPPTTTPATQLPGVNRAIFTPVTSAQSAQAIKSRALPANLNQPQGSSAAAVGGPLVANSSALVGGTTPTGPASIVELARALKNDPDLIYEYVYNNIEYYPVWGIQKGAVGAILDNQGTDFDQADLMVKLLTQAGYTASYVQGAINLTAAQLNAWLGVSTSNVCAVLNLLSQGQIPIVPGTIYASAGGSCPGSTASLVSLSIDHVWVQATIGGTNYYFDPSFKPHTVKTGINLQTVTGYNPATYLSQAESGTTLTADYIQNVNRTNIRNNLNTYATGLTNYLRTNLPSAVLSDVVGGMTINPTPNTKGSGLRQTTLPNQVTSVAVTTWPGSGGAPSSYKPTLNIQYQGINQTYTSDAIYGHRLSITYNTSNLPVLMLDGVTQATGTTAVAVGAASTITFAVTHGAYAQTFANQTFTQQIVGGGTYVIGNGWGPAGRGLADSYRQKLNQAIAAGNAAGSESVLGSSLALLSSTWIAQVNAADYIADHMAGTNTLFHHQVGIAGYNTAPYVDLPGNFVGVVSQAADTAQEAAVFYNAAMHSSIFESTAVQQVSNVQAVSTVKLIDISASSTDKIYNANATNYLATVQPSLISCSAGALTGFQNAVAAGHRLILPTRCNIVENRWTGEGYFDINVTANGSSIGAIIGGGLAGGFASVTETISNFLASAVNLVSSSSLMQSLGQTFGDPIDMTKGNYLYTHDDITTGVGSYPQALNFQRLYSSGALNQNGPLGYGWTHSLAANATVGSDGFQGLGEDSALDAANSLVEMMVSLNLMYDTTKPLANMVVATLGQSWFGDNLINNTVIVKQGLNGEVFVKLPDGSYNAPKGNSALLSLNSTYSYKTLHGDTLNFNTVGNIASYNAANGVQVNFTYNARQLPDRGRQQLREELDAHQPLGPDYRCHRRDA